MQPSRVKGNPVQLQKLGDVIMNLVEPGISTKERVESRTERQTQGQGEGDRAKEAGRERQGKGHRNRERAEKEV